MSPLSAEQRQDVRGLGAAALTHARAADWPATSATVQTIQDRYGCPGINVLLIALADTVIARQRHLAPGNGETVRPVWFDTTEQRIGLADDVPPRVRWAGRFIAARAADDQATAQALVSSCVSAAEFSACVAGLMEVAAHTLDLLDGAR